MEKVLVTEERARVNANKITFELQAKEVVDKLAYDIFDDPTTSTPSTTLTTSSIIIDILTPHP